MYYCDKCEIIFEKKYLLTRHLKRKSSCYKPEKLIEKYKDKIKYIDDEIKKLTEFSIRSNTICQFCKEIFLKKGNMIRHLELNCDIKKNIIKEKNEYNEKINKYQDDIDKLNKDNLINTLNEKIKNINKDIDTIINNNKSKLDLKELHNITNITNNTINNATNITINNNSFNVNINSFGKEKLDHITEADYKKYLNSFFKGLSNLIEKIHFDENVPENHNISFTNLRSKYINIYDNNKWIIIDKNEIVDKIISKKYELLNNKFEELKENNKLTNKITANFEEFQENYNNDEAQKNTKENIKMLLYNNRNKIKKI
jgi:hypothetical protein